MNEKNIPEDPAFSTPTKLTFFFKAKLVGGTITVEYLRLKYVKIC